MSAIDGERIAPVTYLFGAPQAPQGEDESVSRLLSPAATVEAHGGESGPRFLDIGVAEKSAISGKSNLSESSVTEKSPVTGKSKGSFDRISNVSMYALARRGMSSREMRDYLLGREFEGSEVDEEIERLERVALLDDLALAETLIRTLQSRKGLGRSALNAELRRRNIDQLAIESALTVLDDDDELDRATAIAVKRAGQLRSLDGATAKRRLGDFLMRRGYSGSVVSRAVQTALAPTGPVFR